MALPQDSARGKAAQRILDDEVFADALKQLRDGIFTAWTGATNIEERGRLWAMGQTADRFEQVLRSIIADGELAEAELLHINGDKRVIGM